jgi:hypothetical protein
MKSYQFKLREVEVTTPIATTKRLDILHIGEYDKTGKWLRWVPKEEFFFMASKRHLQFIPKEEAAQLL